MIERSPAAQVLIDCAKRIEKERDELKDAMMQIYNNPNCRYEIEAQLGNDVFTHVKSK